MALDVKGALDTFLDDFKTGNVQGMLTKYGDIVLALVRALLTEPRFQEAR